MQGRAYIRGSVGDDDGFDVEDGADDSLYDLTVYKCHITIPTAYTA